MLQIALFLYEDKTALDAVGPYEVLARLPDTEVKFVASTPGPKKPTSAWSSPPTRHSTMSRHRM